MKNIAGALIGSIVVITPGSLALLSYGYNKWVDWKILNLFANILIWGIQVSIIVIAALVFAFAGDFIQTKIRKQIHKWHGYKTG